MSCEDTLECITNRTAGDVIITAHLHFNVVQISVNGCAKDPATLMVVLAVAAVTSETVIVVLEFTFRASISVMLLLMGVHTIVLLAGRRTQCASIFNLSISFFTGMGSVSVTAQISAAVSGQGNTVH